MRKNIDIDETICFYEGSRIYENAIPKQENIDKINKLYDEGWEIIYWTARGSVSERDLFVLTKNQLQDWGCKFHDLFLGKPAADLYIDDRGINDHDFFIPN